MGIIISITMADSLLLLQTDGNGFRTMNRCHHLVALIG